MASETEFEASEELASKVYQLVEKVKSEGKLKKGSNEVTKAIERGEAKLVIAASDVEPQEIVMHLPILCKEKETVFVLVSKKEELGASAGLPVATATVAITNPGGAKAMFDSVVKSISILSKTKTVEVKKEEKPEVKKEDETVEEKPVAKEEKKETKPEKTEEEKPTKASTKE